MSARKAPPTRRIAATLRGIAVAVGLVGAATVAGRAVHGNAATAGFVFIVIVLGVAVRQGLAASIAASLAAAACYNFFFLPPLGTFTIAEPANWVSLATFLVASVVVTRLVSRADRRAREAEERRRELQALAETDAVKTFLLRAVSHDLRSPVTAIRAGLEGLRKRSTDPAAVDALVSMSRETERLSRRIDNLLSLARVEAGTLTPHAEPVPAGDLFRAALEQLPLVLDGIPIEASVADDAPEALADPVLAVEILVNLLENAARFSPEGAPIALVAAADPEEPSRLLLDVRDHGPGVPPAAREGRAAGDAGRGLGLEICRGIARALGGAVTLHDRPGGGTIARLELPGARMGA